MNVLNRTNTMPRTSGLCSKGGARNAHGDQVGRRLASRASTVLYNCTKQVSNHLDALLFPKDRLSNCVSSASGLASDACKSEMILRNNLSSVSIFLGSCGVYRVETSSSEAESSACERDDRVSKIWF
jgi:hypothetical protein